MQWPPPWPTVFTMPVSVWILFTSRPWAKGVCKLISEVLNKHQEEGQVQRGEKVADNGCYWATYHCGQEGLTPTGKLWEMVPYIHLGVIPPRGKGPGVFTQQILHLEQLQEKAVRQSHTGIGSWNYDGGHWRDRGATNNSPRRPLELLSSLDDTLYWNLCRSFAPKLKLSMTL